jgi:hypothetical protein
VARFLATSRVRQLIADPGEIDPSPTPRGCGDEADPCFVFLLTADIKVLVEEQGALFSSSVTDQCTHLITTQKDVEKKGTKCEE